MLNKLRIAIIVLNRKNTQNFMFLVVETKSAPKSSRKGIEPLSLEPESKALSVKLPTRTIKFVGY